MWGWLDQNKDGKFSFGDVTYAVSKIFGGDSKKENDSKKEGAKPSVINSSGTSQASVSTQKQNNSANTKRVNNKKGCICSPFFIRSLLQSRYTNTA